MRYLFLIGILLFPFEIVFAGTTDAPFYCQEVVVSDAANGDQYGFAVSQGGDYMVVGARSDDDVALNAGSAYIMQSNFGTWEQDQKVTASDGAASDQFGNAVAIDGDTAVVGVRDADNTGSVPGVSEGAAYVYVLTNGVWTFQQKLAHTELVANDRFGTSVAIEGDTIVVSADGRDDAGGGAGALYTFTRSGGVWTFQQKLIPADAAANDQHGLSIGLSGDYLISGSLGDNSFAGSAYIYHRSGGVWAEQQKLTAADSLANDRFGFSVSIDGDIAIVGARLGDGVVTDAGSAYVFTRSGATWTLEQKLTSDDGLLNDEFGYSVAVSGDTALVSARLDDVTLGVNAGSAYVFLRNGTTWTQSFKLLAPDGAANDSFGLSVWADDTTMFIGSFLHDHGIADSGSVYVCDLYGPTVTTATALGVNRVEAILNGNVSDAGSITSTSRGFNYGLTADYGATTTETTTFSEASFLANLADLECNTTYHYRAYAVNSTSTIYGSDNSFNTSNCPHHSDSNRRSAVSVSNVSSASSVTASHADSSPDDSPLFVPKTISPALSKDLYLGLVGREVKQLQIFLNAQGFAVAQTGPGSSGQETDKFGPLTKAALIRFQLAHKISPAVGYLGPVTRGVISSMFVGGQ